MADLADAQEPAQRPEIMKAISGWASWGVTALKRMGESKNYCERIQPMPAYRALTNGEGGTERINPWSMTVCLDCSYCVPAWNGTGGCALKMYQPVNNVNGFLIVVG
ncbi:MULTISPECIES: hypothetical protein [Pseudomonas syringae group]|nr:hypothetical protein [Pseudomonas viridiflava]MCF8979409.1 hypothetical protein [Pseudomonas syringae]MBI6703247.1 hypothetical protein [Pseudomonas viridiflava]MBI6722371.1 hypothetical protein [Pseudomonas viridiflava]MEE4088758.1 hypothetical protein [Pseudomonas viridiflava]QXG26621.1 hypothetical protein KTT56_07175 [Pseudomonas viridiflava]